MRVKCVAVVLLLIIQGSFGNTYGQEILKNKAKIDGATISYYVMQPQQQVKGILILLPGWGESLSSIFKKTSLPQRLADNGYLTIVPELHQTLFADDFTIAELNWFFKTQSVKYNLIEPDLILGGLSAGGAIAIGYAEYLLASDTMPKPKGVFAIDPPLDLERMYASAERKIKYDCGGLIRKEGYFIKGYLENALSGSPQSKPDQYIRHASYSARSSDGANAKWLKDIPIRLYTEPDLAFVRKTYCEELQFEDINAFDLEKLHAFLLQLGNKRCEYITTLNKGFHSWNIVDAADCVNWILGLKN